MDMNMAAFASYVGTASGPVDPEAASMISAIMTDLDTYMNIPFTLEEPVECGMEFPVIDGPGYGYETCTLPFGHEGVCGSGDPPN